MDASIMEDLSDPLWRSTIGISESVFDEIYQQFCVVSRSPIRTRYAARTMHAACRLQTVLLTVEPRRWHLFVLFYWMKNYPPYRSLATTLGYRTDNERISLMRRLRGSAVWLAARMANVVPRFWEDRYKTSNPLSGLVTGNVIGYVDTAPIRIRLPKNKAWAGACYNGGKYKAAVLKVQVIVGHSGLPIFVSGPHVGVRSDLRLFRENGPVALMRPLDIVIGDKAYVGGQAVGLIAPFKQNCAGGMDKEKEAYNTLIRSYF
jgi:hypothetical protein